MVNKAQSSRSLRTKAALIESGIKLMQHRSIDAISIDDIVKTAGVGKGSFFNHFRNKQNYADAIADNIREELTGYFKDAIKGISDPLLCLAIACKN